MEMDTEEVKRIAEESGELAISYLDPQETLMKEE